jgi:hypothetical protein
MGRPGQRLLNDIYIEMREGMGCPGQRLLNATEKVYRNEGRDKNSVFCISYNVLQSFIKI